jgi:ParB family transcriptional regulator, chromosome partitioning protein
MTRDQRIVYLNPRDLEPSRPGVRSDPGDLAGLAETIREHGVLQPLGVAEAAGGYRVIFGNRRRDAAIVVGLDRVPCIVLEGLDDAQALVQQALENLQRLDLNDLDKAHAFEGMLAHAMDQGLSQGDALEGMARTLGLSSRQIQRYLRLRQLAPGVQRLIASGDLGVTHGQHLADLLSAARQEAVAELAVEETLSAAELARLCAALQHNVNIDPYQALVALRRGERIASVEAAHREPLPRLGPAPTETAEPDPWVGEDGEDGEEDEADGAGASPRRALPERLSHDGEYAHLEPTTRDGNRVRRIHSLDAFMDELQRLAVCVQEGDLQRLLEEDDVGDVKIKLAARQLRFLAEAVAALAQG